MFLNLLRGQQMSPGFWKDAAGAEHALKSMQPAPDDQLVADCRSFISQMGAVLNDIEQAADCDSGGHGLDQASLCEAEDQAFDLVSRIVITPAFGDHGVQSKHAVADVMLAIDWYDEPSPYRDALLHSFVLDAARLQYPAVSDGEASTREDLDATTTVIVRVNACLAAIKEVAAGFAQRDQNALLGQADQDANIIALIKRKETAIEALIGVQAYSASAIHAKRFVLRRMLETDAGDSDADYLRIDLARSYLSDLNAFFRANTHEHEPSSAYNSIWNTVTSKLRWLTSAVHHR